MGSRPLKGEHAAERGTFLFALAAMLLVAALDTVLGARALLLQLLLVGPLIAAMGSSVALTVVAALVALSLAVPLGLASDSFADAEHLTAIVAVFVGSVLAVIIARLRERRERTAARLEVQYGVARLLADASSFAAVGSNLLEAIGRPLGWSTGQIWQPDGEGRLRCVARWHELGIDTPEFDQVSDDLAVAPGHGLPGRVWESGEVAWLENLATGRGFLRGAEAEASGLRGGMAFPVRAGSGPLAVVEFFSRGRRDPEPDLMALTEALGSQIAEFLVGQRATLAVRASEAQATEARDQLEGILRGVADAITAQAPDGTLLFANDAAVQQLGYSSSEELFAARLTDVVERFEMLAEDGTAFPPEDLPGRRALAGEDGAEAVIRFRVRGTGEERWSVVKSTPIKDTDGRVTMAINVIEDITAHKRSEEAQRFLAESSVVLASSLNPDELLTRVASLVVPRVADWCAVHLRDELGELRQVTFTHADPTQRELGLELARRFPEDPDSGRGWYSVVRSGRTELYSDPTAELLRSTSRGSEYSRQLEALELTSAMIVPMMARGRAIGTLTFVTAGSRRRFDQIDVDLAEELARRCATAIDNARLYTERSYIARTLQESLLPVELPDIPGIEAAARFRPTGEGNEVGGDFYDMFESGGRGWTVVIGDVCGKGPDAAAVTALARYTLRAAAMRQRVPSRSLGLLNEALLRQRDDRRFCTVAYAYLEMLDSGARVGFASGGHPLPLLLRPDGTVTTVGEPGSLLGVMQDPKFVDRAVSLSAGDALVFYTDGVIEGRGGQGALDENSLPELVASCAGRGADAIAARVEQEAVRSQGGRPRDDIAVLVLRVAA